MITLSHSKHDAGFTLLEVLVALTILSIASAAMATGYMTNLKFNAQAERRSGAITAAQQVLDGLRVQDPSTLPASGTSLPQTVTIGSRSYSVTTTYCSPSTYCTSGNIRFITATVTYKGTVEYTVDTIYTQLR